jgi:hemoglobin-like flavoprotein
MKETYELTLESYHRCEASGGFFDTFYDIFFTKSPEIPPKFASTDMEKQKQIVMASVLMVLRLETGDPAARKYVEEIAESHSRRGHDIPPKLYDLWLDALCETVEKHDPQYTPELGVKWREVMRPGIEMMIAAY